MKNSQKGSIVSIILILIILIAIIILYSLGQQKVTIDTFAVADANTAIDEFTIEYSTPTNDQLPTVNGSSETIDRMKVTIFVPKDNIAYTEAMERYTSNGGKNPADTTVFAKEEVEVAYSDDKILASANAAARMYTRSENAPFVAYLKIENSIAYIVLTLDLNEHEGGPVAINEARPVVAKTLLQFPEIKSVVFGMAPGDEQNIQELIVR